MSAYLTNKILKGITNDSKKKANDEHLIHFVDGHVAVVPKVVKKAVRHRVIVPVVGSIVPTGSAVCVAHQVYVARIGRVVEIHAHLMFFDRNGLKINLNFQMVCLFLPCLFSFYIHTRAHTSFISQKLK